jgi:hypothetical protein
VRHALERGITVGLAERSCWASSMLMCAGIAANAAPVRIRSDRRQQYP